MQVKSSTEVQQLRRDKELLSAELKACNERIAKLESERQNQLSLSNVIPDGKFAQSDCSMSTAHEVLPQDKAPICQLNQNITNDNIAACSYATSPIVLTPDSVSPKDDYNPTQYWEDKDVKFPSQHARNDCLGGDSQKTHKLVQELSISSAPNGKNTAGVLKSQGDVPHDEKSRPRCQKPFPLVVKVPQCNDQAKMVSSPQVTQSETFQVRVECGMISKVPQSLRITPKRNPCAIFSVFDPVKSEVKWCFAKEYEQLRNFNDVVRLILVPLTHQNRVYLTDFPSKNLFQGRLVPWKVDMRIDMMNAFFRSISALYTNKYFLRDKKARSSLQQAMSALWLHDIVDMPKHIPISLGVEEVMRGFLMARSSLQNKWQQYYCVLNGAYLDAIEDGVSSTITKSIPLHAARIIMKITFYDTTSTDERYAIRIYELLKSKRYRIHQFTAETETVRQKWLFKLRERVESLDNKSVSRTYRAFSGIKDIPLMYSLRASPHRSAYLPNESHKDSKNKEHQDFPETFSPTTNMDDTSSRMSCESTSFSMYDKLQSDDDRSTIHRQKSREMYDGGEFYMRISQQLNPSRPQDASQATSSSTETLDVCGQDAVDSTMVSPTKAGSLPKVVKITPPIKSGTTSPCKAALTPEQITISAPMGLTSLRKLDFEGPSLVPADQATPLIIRQASKSRHNGLEVPNQHIDGQSPEHSLGKTSGFGTMGFTNTSPARQGMLRRPSFEVKGIVFGVLPNKAQFMSKMTSGEQIPTIVARCVVYLDSPRILDEKGLFRISGSGSLIDELQDAFETHGDADLKSSNYDSHTVADLLKRYLRVLPVSILGDWTEERSAKLLTAPDKECPAIIRSELLKLHPICRSTAHYILRLLHRVSQHAAANSMSLENLGVALSPALKTPTAVIRLCIRHQEEIFS